MDLAVFHAVARLLPQPLLLCTPRGRVLAANAAATRAADALRAGADLPEISGAPEALRAQLATWLRSGSALPGSLSVPLADGSAVRFRCHGARAVWWTGPEPLVQLHLSRLDLGDRFVALSRQVRLLDRQMAYRRTVEEQRERLLATEKAARERLQRLYRLTASLAVSATLSDVCDAVHKSAPQALDATAVSLELHSKRIVPSLGPTDALASAGTTWTDLDAPGARTWLTPAHHAGDRPAPAAGTDGGAARPAADTGDGDRHGEVVRRVPLEAEGLTLGHLTVRCAPGVRPDDEHIRAVAQQIAQAVRRAGLFEHEHRLAERLQRSLLPSLPEVDGVEIASAYAPGTHMVNVGGDWYDVHVLDADTIGLTIGDVAGHGVAEATAMAQISTALRSIARRCGRRPAAVLEEVNDFLNAYHEGLMATACYAMYSRRTGILRYARAGHPPPLLIGADGGSRYLSGALAPPLGPVPFTGYAEEEVPVSDGDTLVLYTDGLIERRGEAMDTGLARLVQLGRSTVGLGARETCALFLHQQPDTELPDDCALLVARFSVEDGDDPGAGGTTDAPGGRQDRPPRRHRPGK
ncbi:SpoIIE family protein phosphatase [Streptomyces sp. LP05-1]|uniref:SpoIIE family protein phosphatase n=1 Tax=Streptomyces pyxinae TaxID=2970734 RepID=A0ABT2CPX3_9ACTN|nr:SpoIIE family protein phosphatase [Streptomyces sp. LP05-1]MCS0639479.1 SpoIIE family protein phosphatase [Streptomyces sp. LP05-1]